MNRKKRIVKDGLSLLLISVIYRLVSFAFFSFSWQWSGSFIRIIEVAIGIFFLSIWFIHGFKKRAGLKNGLLVGIVGTSDAILLIAFSSVLYINRSSYYFGPIEMVLWNIPLLGVYNFLSFKTDFISYTAPLIAIMLTALGSLLGYSKPGKLHEKHIDT